MATARNTGSSQLGGVGLEQIRRGSAWPRGLNPAGRPPGPAARTQWGSGAARCPAGASPPARRPEGVPEPPGGRCRARRRATSRASGRSRADPPRRRTSARTAAPSAARRLPARRSVEDQRREGPGLDLRVGEPGHHLVAQRAQQLRLEHPLADPGREGRVRLPVADLRDQATAASRRVRRPDRRAADPPVRRSRRRAPAPNPSCAAG